jgi:IclR family pca regulon transcriptional regulator
VRQDGYAINDEELELGLRSIAVPVRGASGQVLAALNVGAQAARVSAERMKQEFLPVLRGARRSSRCCCPRGEPYDTLALRRCGAGRP